jgi:Leucine-rich repeat (LRR) protein
LYFNVGLRCVAKIFRLPWLQKLDLSDNELTDLTPIGRLIHLKELLLSKNQMSVRAKRQKIFFHIAVRSLSFYERRRRLIILAIDQNSIRW